MTGTTTEPSPPPSPPPSDARRGPGRAAAAAGAGASRRLWLVFAVLAAAFVFLLVEGLGSSLDYFDTVDQAFAHRATLGTHDVPSRGHRRARHHPRHRRRHRTSPSAKGANVVHVANTGSPPQLFQPNIPVVVVGHFTSATSTEFVSNSILVKHSATYIAAAPGPGEGRTTGPAC